MLANFARNRELRNILIMHNCYSWTYRQCSLKELNLKLVEDIKFFDMQAVEPASL